MSIALPEGQNLRAAQHHNLCGTPRPAVSQNVSGHGPRPGPRARRSVEAAIRHLAARFRNGKTPGPLGDPKRFADSYDVGAYLGLTSRIFQSGEVAYQGRISKWGDALARHMLYEAANSLMVRVKAWSAPKVWAARLARKIGPKKARVAPIFETGARKLAVILHRIWLSGDDFRWTKEATA